MHAIIFKVFWTINPSLVKTVVGFKTYWMTRSVEKISIFRRRKGAFFKKWCNALQVSLGNWKIIRGPLHAKRPIKWTPKRRNLAPIGKKYPKNIWILRHRRNRSTKGASKYLRGVELGTLNIFILMTKVKVL